jgi:hypothetical protein
LTTVDEVNAVEFPERPSTWVILEYHLSQAIL